MGVIDGDRTADQEGVIVRIRDVGKVRVEAAIEVGIDLIAGVAPFNAPTATEGLNIIGGLWWGWRWQGYLQGPYLIDHHAADDKDGQADDQGDGFGPSGREKCDQGE